MTEQNLHTLPYSLQITDTDAIKIILIGLVNKYIRYSYT